MKLLCFCLLSVIPSLTLCGQYNYNYNDNYQTRPNNAYKSNQYNNVNNYNSDNNNNYNYNNNKNYNYNDYYANQKPRQEKLTRRYTIEGEARHTHNKHGENHLKAFGAMFGFGETYQTSDYTQATTFHSGSIYGKNGKKRKFSTYDTEGEVKHNQKSKGRAKLKMYANLYGHERVEDKKDVKAIVTYENDGSPSEDDVANYSPTEHPYGKLEDYQTPSYTSDNTKLKY
ncbi:unnamed protein product [Trichobilharzia regenti]|uniref:Trematode Eggshell Synthesis domain containing protein n=1 Tax=Trichobilharzia regenti TaxID=157069 RepID=A0A183VNL2_TRIRE|nr:unnamed protein product [Trichobilharzia regenti]VDP97947.1 unnamed protein product [Trichobilharzia regenti]